MRRVAQDVPTLNATDDPRGTPRRVALRLNLTMTVSGPVSGQTLREVTMTSSCFLVFFEKRACSAGKETRSIAFSLLLNLTVAYSVRKGRKLRGVRRCDQDDSETTAASPG